MKKVIVGILTLCIIGATLWFGNLGAIFPKYKAIYKNGQWQFEVI
jgi:hypothetical protein